jgi:putative ABC transport system ATP-binding protein
MSEAFWSGRGSAGVIDEGEPIAAVRDLVRDYPIGESVVQALRGVSFTLGRGQLIALQGRSGSGKTTLLTLLGGLERPTSGEVWIDGREVTAMDEDALVELRRHRLGFIFQTFGLIPILSAAENVEVPLRLAGVERRARAERARALLDMVGLGERARHRPDELSGGEQQRVAIARALANRPPLLLADEPTGQLDSRTARTIMQLLRSLVEREGVSALVATHDPLLIDLADRVLVLRDGRLVEGGA